MKFVALVSGGKDSCFNILHCLANGHELACLANLYPPPSDSDEMDSFMYQTVGHDVLSFYSECIGKPIYRQQINGQSKNQKLEYKKTENDETEDLYKLLSTVLENHPEVEAVSVGAILSSYQRTRVEDVCSRLGLTSLAYLWQRNQTELMSEMCESGMEAILIKVAAIGLDQTHLGITLQEAFPTLLSLNDKFGVHVCGEGGEFETLVLDAPFFEKGRLVIKEKQVIRHTNDDVWYLKIKVEVEPKEPSTVVFDWRNYIKEPALLLPKFEDISGLVRREKKATAFNNVQHSVDTQNWKFNSTRLGSKLFVSNITSKQKDLESQIEDIFKQLDSELKFAGLNFSNIQVSSLIVKDMSDFAKINSIYKNYFEDPLPPARVCVESNVLPGGVLAQLSVTVIDDLSFKQGLHVQGRSYWAPSNIGPYSQTIIDRRDQIAPLSGQIPLIPKNMELCNDLVLSTLLSLQHLDNVKEVMNVQTNLLMVAFIKDEAWLDVTAEVYKMYKPEDLEYRNNFLIVKVSEIPKGANIEWGGLSYKEIVDYDYDYEEADNETEPVTNVKKVSISFYDDLSEVTFENDMHYKIYCNPSILKSEIRAGSYELIPVLGVYSGDKKSRSFGVVTYAYTKN